jgi:calcium binding protein 39
VFHSDRCLLLALRRFYTFPDYIEKTTFGVSCDAFANFKECLTKHKPMVAEYLERNYDKVSSALPIASARK